MRWLRGTININTGGTTSRPGNTILVASSAPQQLAENLHETLGNQALALALLLERLGVCCVKSTQKVAT